MNNQKDRIRKVKRYFALSRELGYSGQEAKAVAKKMFKVASFNELTAINLDKLIEKAELVKTRRDYEQENRYRK